MSYLLNRKRFGAVLRVFSAHPKNVKVNAEQVLAAARKASYARIRGKALFSKILIMVAADKRYIDHDCGLTLKALQDGLSKDEPIEAREVTEGDLFCGVLNYGLSLLRREQIDYALIMSHGAADYLQSTNLEAMVKAFENDALVTGLAIEELKQSVLEGRIANTFAMWRISALQRYGGFDLRAEQPMAEDKTAPFFRGWDDELGDVFYPVAGVEEILPLIKLVKHHGECIAPIEPIRPGTWKEPDRVSDPAGFSRHMRKMATKTSRQMAFAALERVDFSFLLGGVMEAYRTSNHVNI